MRSVILLCILLAQNAFAFHWSEGNLRQVGFDEKKFKQFVEFAFADDQDGIRTESLLIIKNSKIVFEKYAHGFDKNKKHRIWSITKSFINAMFGILESKGMVDVSLPISTYLKEYPNYQNKEFENVTVDSLLKMNSGLQWDESYSNPFKSNVIKMLYSAVRKDMGDYAAKVGMNASPVKEFKYSSGTSNLLMLIFKKIINNQSAHDEFPWKELFSKLNMKNVTWEQDKSGTFVGSSYLFMTPRDLAKFCQLYINRGRVGNQQILKTIWIKDSLIPSKASAAASEDNKWYGYGKHFWTNAHADGKRRHPQMPKDLFFALGHNGQIMACFPSENMILVRNAHDTEKLDRDKFYDLFWKAYE